MWLVKVMTWTLFSITEVIYYRMIWDFCFISLLPPQIKHQNTSYEKRVAPFFCLTKYKVRVTFGKSITTTYEVIHKAWLSRKPLWLGLLTLYVIRDE